MNFYPSPDHYKPRISLTNPKLLKKTFGYHFDPSNLTVAPGPGSYNVRSSLKGEIKDFVRRTTREKPHTTKTGKRKTKSKSSRKKSKSKNKMAKSAKNLKIKSFKTMRETSNDFRKTAFTTYFLYGGIVNF